MGSDHNNIDREKVHDVGVMIGEIIDSFQSFFTKIADCRYVSEQDKNMMILSLEESKKKLNKILLFARQL